jgi:hypothetical protein
MAKIDLGIRVSEDKRPLRSRMRLLLLRGLCLLKLPLEIDDPGSSTMRIRTILTDIGLKDGIVFYIGMKEHSRTVVGVDR